MIKQCCRCKQDKLFSDFGKKQKAPDGLQSACSECRKLEMKLLYEKNAVKNREAAKIKYWENPELSRENMRQRRENTPDVFKKSSAKNYQKNKDKRRADSKLYVTLNSKRACERANNWKKANKPLVTEMERRRYAKKLRAFPVWANKDAIKAIYIEAQEFRDAGFNVHVDHIVPLQSKLVCGLHVESNLRILLAEHNIKKSNKVWPDMPST